MVPNHLATIVRETMQGMCIDGLWHFQKMTNYWIRCPVTANQIKTCWFLQMSTWVKISSWQQFPNEEIHPSKILTCPLSITEASKFLKILGTLKMSICINSTGGALDTKLV